MGKKFYAHKIERLVWVDSIVTVHYMEYPKGYAFPGESHNFWELVYVDRGSVLCSRNRDEEFPLQKGQLLFHKPNEFHTIRTDGESMANVLVLSFYCRSEAMRFFDDRIFLPDRKQTALLSDIITEAENTFDLPTFAPELTTLPLKQEPVLGGLQMIKLNLEKLLILLLRNGEERRQVYHLHSAEPQDGLAQSVMHYLDENLYGKITLSDICRQCNYGKTTLCTVFKRHTGQSVFQYLSIRKVEEAKRLIRKGDVPYKRIAEMLGYDSYSYFVKVFRDATGYLPKEYAKLLYAKEISEGASAKKIIEE
ncbi:MAG: helix-turn-helix domain-containing protein [Clostridia bacterium]|nr:helix-turn-helix domain-containing protein [Clostridia bacterium]